MDLDFSIIDTIKQRHSVRTYENKPLRQQTIDDINTFISGLSNPLGITGIEIPLTRRAENDAPEKLGTYGMIKGASTFAALITDNDPVALLMAAYEFETLILYLTSKDLGTVWLGGTFNRKDFSNAVSFNKSKILPAVSPIGYAAPQRWVEKVTRKIAKSDYRKPWEQLFFDGNLSTPLIPHDAGRYAEPLQMVRIAPSATNKQPWRIIKTGDDFVFYGAFVHKPDNLEVTMRYLDMGIAMCHFELSSIELNNPGNFVIDDVPPVSLPAEFTYIATWKSKK